MTERPLWTSILINSLIPLLLIGGSITGAYFLYKSKQKPGKRPAPIAIPVVKVKTIKKQNYQVIIKSRGTIRAHTKSTLIPSVSGKVIKISKAFQNGAFIEKDELLLTIDKRDFEVALVEATTLHIESQQALEEVKVKTQNYATLLAISQAKLKESELALAEGKAQAEQAEQEWKDLGKKEAPSDLVLRKPHLEAVKAVVKVAEAEIKLRERDLELVDAQIKTAEAKILAAKALINRRENDLDRCYIRAPYAGRILQRLVDVGQYVSPSTVMAEIYAVDFVEVHLPISNHSLDYINLPEIFRSGDKENITQLNAILYVKFGSKNVSYNAKIMRTESIVDKRSRQLFVIGKVDNPYEKKENINIPLKVGTFVLADIEGNLLEGVYILPRQSVINDRILVVNQKNEARYKDVRSIYKDSKVYIIKESLKPGERLCLTSLNFATDQTIKVNIEGEMSQSPKTKLPEGKK